MRYAAFAWCVLAPIVGWWLARRFETESRTQAVSAAAWTVPGLVFAAMLGLDFAWPIAGLVALIYLVPALTLTRRMRRVHHLLATLDRAEFGSRADFRGAVR